MAYQNGVAGSVHVKEELALNTIKFVRLKSPPLSQPVKMLRVRTPPRALPIINDTGVIAVRDIG